MPEGRRQRREGCCVFGARYLDDWNDPFARMFLQILAVIAEFEANLIRQRTREGMAIARQNGKLRGKQPTAQSPPRTARSAACTTAATTTSSRSPPCSAPAGPPCTGPWTARLSSPRFPAGTRPVPDVTKYGQLLTRNPGQQ